MTELSAATKAAIDAMPIVDMMSRWMFDPIGTFQIGDPYSEYFQKVMLDKRDAYAAEWTAASKFLSR